MDKKGKIDAILKDIKAKKESLLSLYDELEKSLQIECLKEQNPDKNYKCFKYFSSFRGYSYEVRYLRSDLVDSLCIHDAEYLLIKQVNPKALSIFICKHGQPSKRLKGFIENNDIIILEAKRLM